MLCLPFACLSMMTLIVDVVRSVHLEIFTSEMNDVGYFDVQSKIDLLSVKAIKWDEPSLWIWAGHASWLFRIRYSTTKVGHRCPRCLPIKEKAFESVHVLHPQRKEAGSGLNAENYMHTGNNSWETGAFHILDLTFIGLLEPTTGKTCELW